MHQNSRAKSSTQSSPAIALHPVLSLALANLDIQLEDELVRYRRQRTSVGRAVPQPDRKQAPHQLGLIAVAATTDRPNTSDRPNTARISAAQNGAAAQVAPALDERLNGVSEPPIAADAYKPTPAFTANPQPFDGAIALRTPVKPLAQGGSNEQASLAVEADEAHALAHAADPNLDDYLESSEELLRSLADEQAEVQAERNFMQSLLTPLGLGSMLLLLLSSAMFGYVIMNPSSLGWLAVKQNGQSTSTPSGQAPGQAVLAPPQPDLAKRQLPELNLNNLGTVNVNPGTTSTKLSTPAQTTATPSSKPTIAAAKASNAQPSSSSESFAASTQTPLPATTAESNRPAPARVALPPQPVSSRSAPTRAPAPTAPTQTAPPPTASAPIAPAPTITSRGSGATDSYQYKVGIPFENDQTLETARKVVPDAFVRTLPDGRTIVQLGAARSQTEVNVNIQGLRNQGLPSAEVYKR